MGWSELAARWLVLSSISFAVATCRHSAEPASADVESTLTEVDTLASGVVRVHNRLAGSIENLRLAAVIDGGDASNAPFGHVEALAVDRLGRAYIADSQANVVEVFDSSGVFVRRLGRPGQGPGEFDGLLGLAWRDGATLWVFDFGNGRYSVYDTTGALKQDVPRPPMAVLWPWPGRWQGGELVETLDSRFRDALVGLQPSDSAPWLVAVDTFPSPLLGRTTAARPFFTLRSPTTVRLVAIPFAPTLVWALDGQGAVWVGDGRDLTLVRRDLAGDTVLIVRNDWTPFAVGRDERDSAVAALGPREAVARSLDVEAIPKTKPALVQLTVADDEELWVLRPGSAATWLFDVFGRDGRHVATYGIPVSIDPDVLPVVAGNSVWMVGRDQFGVQSAVRLLRPEH